MHTWVPAPRSCSHTRRSRSRGATRARRSRLPRARHADVPAWPFDAWLGIGYLVAFGTTVGFVLFYWAVRRFGAGIGAMSSYMVPVAALLLAFVFLGERPDPLQLVGGAVILLGVRLTTLGVPRPEVTEAAA